MTASLNTAAFLEEWLSKNSDRLNNRFRVSRVNDWSLWEEQGIGFDLEGEFTSGRFTAWVEPLGNAGRPFADAEAIDEKTGRLFFARSFQPLSTELLDSWLAALEDPFEFTLRRYSAWHWPAYDGIDGPIGRAFDYAIVRAMF